MKRTFVQNTIFNVGYKVLNVIFPLITSMYVARILGPDGVGRVSYAQNIVGYFLIFASVGIPTYGIKEIARNETSKERYSKSFSELFLINFFTTTTCIIVYVLLISQSSYFKFDSSIYFAVGITLFLNYFNIDWFYAGLEEYAYITIRSTIIKILAIIALFFFVRTKEDVITYALVSSIGVSANYILNIIHVKSKVALSFRHIEIKKHIKPVVILLFTMVATDLYNQIDITMMGGYCSKAEIGYYTYAIRLIRIITSIATAISATMLPRLSRYYNDGIKETFQQFTNKVLGAVIVFVIPASIGVALCANNIVVILYGEAFQQSVPLIHVLCSIVFIISISYLCGSVVLTAINKEKYLLYATIIGAVVNIMINLVLIPQFHGKGAAIASVIAELTVLLAHYLFSRKYVSFRFFSMENVKPIISVVFMVFVVWIINKSVNMPIVNLLLSITCGASVYFILLYIMKHRLVMEGIEKIKNRLIKSKQK